MKKIFLVLCLASLSLLGCKKEEVKPIQYDCENNNTFRLTIYNQVLPHSPYYFYYEDKFIGVVNYSDMFDVKVGKIGKAVFINATDGQDTIVKYFVGNTCEAISVTIQ